MLQTPQIAYLWIKGIGRYEIHLEKVLLMIILNQKNEKQKPKIKTHQKTNTRQYLP